MRASEMNAPAGVESSGRGMVPSGRPGEGTGSDSNPDASHAHEVQCRRQDGRWRVWNRYETSQKAKAVADCLLRAGCEARVVPLEVVEVDGGGA